MKTNKEIAAEMYAANASTVAAKVAKRKDTFRRGETTFNCAGCGRLTRRSGNNGCDMCAECFDSFGRDNTISDGELSGVELDRELANIHGNICKAVSAGGKNISNELMCADALHSFVQRKNSIASNNNKTINTQNKGTAMKTKSTVAAKSTVKAKAKAAKIVTTSAKPFGEKVAKVAKEKTKKFTLADAIAPSIIAQNLTDKAIASTATKLYGKAVDAAKVAFFRTELNRGALVKCGAGYPAGKKPYQAIA